MAGYDGRGARFDIIAVEGADLSFTVTAVDSAGDPVDLSAATIVGTVYNPGNVTLDTLNTVVSGDGSNTLTLSMTPAELAALTVPRSWSLEIERDGDNRTWLAGDFSIAAPDDPRASSATTGTAVTATVDTNVVVTAAVLTGTPGPAGTTGPTGPSGPRATVDDTPPSGPTDGDFWVDTGDLSLYVYYDDGMLQQWVAVSGPAGADGVDGADGADGTAATNAHIADTDGAHAASAISVADTGELFTATTVEAALAEVKTAADAAGGGVSLGQARTVPASGDIGWSTPMASTITTLATAEGQIIGVPLVVSNDCTVDRIRCNVTSAGATGAVVRLGIYELSPTSQTVHTLVVDGGTVDVTSTGIKTVTISQALTTGKVYLVVCAAQGAAATRATLSAITGGVPIVGNGGATVAPLSAGYAGNNGQAAGALPAETSGVQLWRATFENAPLLGVRFAA